MKLKNLPNSFQIPKLPSTLILQSKANNKYNNHVNCFSSSRPKPIKDCDHLKDKPHHQPYPQRIHTVQVDSHKWLTVAVSLNHNHNHLYSVNSPSECSTRNPKKANLRHLPQLLSDSQLPSTLTLQIKANNKNNKHFNCFSSSRLEKGPTINHNHKGFTNKKP